MNQQTHSSHPPIKTYLMVFAGLGVLTALTVGLSYMHLSHTMGLILAGVISLAKCVLIAAFFMHLRNERKVIGSVIYVALALIAILLIGIIPDLGIVN